MRPPWLVIRTLDGHDHALPVSAGTTTVGRSRTSHLWINHASVSRHHAVLAVIGDTWLIRDLGSRNGTFLNNTRVREEGFRLGDRLRFGAVEALVVPDEPTAKTLLSEDPEATGSARRSTSRRRAAKTVDLSTLSPAETAVLRLLLEGLTEQKIADALGKKYYTVHNQVQSIYEKLNVHSRGELFTRLGRRELEQ